VIPALNFVASELRNSEDHNFSSAERYLAGSLAGRAGVVVGNYPFSRIPFPRCARRQTMACIDKPMPAAHAVKKISDCTKISGEST